MKFKICIINTPGVGTHFQRVYRWRGKALGVSKVYEDIEPETTDSAGGTNCHPPVVSAMPEQVAKLGINEETINTIFPLQNMAI